MLLSGATLLARGPLLGGVTPGIALQTVRPASDITAGTWTPSTGVVLYAMLDETVADDTDYILSATNPSSDTCEVKLSTPATTPSVDTDHSVAYRCGSVGATCNLVVSLYQGATLIKSWTHTALALGLQTFTQALTSSEAAAITDYTDLRLRFVAS